MMTQSKIRIALAKQGFRPASEGESGWYVTVNVGTERNPEVLKTWATNKPKILPSVDQLMDGLFQVFATRPGAVGVSIGAMYDTWKIVVSPVGSTVYSLPEAGQGLSLVRARELATALLEQARK